MKILLLFSLSPPFPRVFKFHSRSYSQKLFEKIPGWHEPPGPRKSYLGASWKSMAYRLSYRDVNNSTHNSRFVPWLSQVHRHSVQVCNFVEKTKIGRIVHRSRKVTQAWREERRFSLTCSPVLQSVTKKKPERENPETLSLIFWLFTPADFQPLLWSLQAR